MGDGKAAMSGFNDCVQVALVDLRVGFFSCIAIQTDNIAIKLLIK